MRTRHATIVSGTIVSGMLALAMFCPLLAAAGPVLQDPAVGQIAEMPVGRIWCYDKDRSLVTQKAAWRCAGQVISKSQAQKIQAMRIRRVQDVMKGRQPLFEGGQLGGTGSGFFISGSGAVLTNWHVVDGCKWISITPAGGEAIAAELVASEKSKDLALLRTDFRPRTYASFRSVRKVHTSEGVAVVGYPLHGRVAIKPIFVSGHVIEDTKVRRPGRFPMKIDVRRGNSGGPVLDRAGRIVGVVVAKVNTLQVYATTGRVVRNVGIAIALPIALDFLRQHDVRFREIPSAPALTDSELFSRAQKFVGQIGCWR